MRLSADLFGAETVAEQAETETLSSTLLSTPIDEDRMPWHAEQERERHAEAARE